MFNKPRFVNIPLCKAPPFMPANATATKITIYINNSFAGEINKNVYTNACAQI
jgi:hypothetical protein